MADEETDAADQTNEQDDDSASSTLSRWSGSGTASATASQDSGGPLVRMPPFDPSFDPYDVIKFAAAQPQWFVKPTTRAAANALFQRAAETIKIQQNAQRLDGLAELSKTRTFIQGDTQKKAAEILKLDTSALPASVLNKFFPDADGKPQTFNGDDVLAINDAYKKVVIPSKQKDYAPVDAARFVEFYNSAMAGTDDVAKAVAQSEYDRRTKNTDEAAAMTKARVRSLTTRLDSAQAALAGYQADNSEGGKQKATAKQAEIASLQSQLDTLNKTPVAHFMGARIPLTPGAGGTASPDAVPTVTSKAQFDALPSGAVYVGKDGTKYRKP